MCVENRVVLTAVIVKKEALRFTPGGLQAIVVMLEHESEQVEANFARQVRAQLKAVAFGSIAEQISEVGLNILLTFSGFLASRKNASYPILHILHIQQSLLSRGP